MQPDEFSPPTRAWQAQGRWITVAGLRVFVVERGAGPAVLFVHGFPTSSYDWRAVGDLLAPARRVITLDLPGFGLSDKPDAYSYSLFQQADVVEAVAQSLGADRLHVVSHDLGTSVHTELLARRQEGRLGFDLRSSTFLNGSMLQWLATITPFQQMLAANASLPQAIELCNSPAMLQMYLPALKSIMRKPEVLSADDETVMLELLRYADGQRRLPALAGYMRERYVHQERWIGALTRETGPLQLVWADGDPIANIDMGRELHRMCPQAPYTELAGIGHFLLMEDPAAVAAAIGPFTAAA